MVNPIVLPGKSLFDLNAKVEALAEAANKLDRNKAATTGCQLVKDGMKIWEVFHSHYGSEDNPLPIGLGLVEVLCNQKIQRWGETRCTIAKAARIFMEFSLLKADLEGSGPILAPTKEEHLSAIEKLIDALPEDQVEMWLELKCLRAIFKYFEGAGHSRRYLKQGIKSTITLSVGDYCQLLGELLVNERQSGSWFATTGYWRWFSSQAITPKGFDLLYPDILSHLGKARKVSLSAAEVLISIYTHAKDDMVKDKSFKALLPLTQITKDSQLKQVKIRATFWKTRLVAVKFLGTPQISKASTRGSQAITQLADCFLHEKNICVLTELFILCYSDREKWIDAIHQSKKVDVFNKRLESIEKLFQPLQALYEKSKTSIKNKEEALERWEKEQLQLKQQKENSTNLEGAGGQIIDEDMHGNAITIDSRIKQIEADKPKLEKEIQQELPVLKEYEKKVKDCANFMGDFREFLKELNESRVTT